jgi:hypothetical protein
MQFLLTLSLKRTAVNDRQLMLSTDFVYAKIFFRFCNVRPAIIPAIAAQDQKRPPG